MKQITDFAKSHQSIVVGALVTILITAVVVITVPMIGSSINEARIGKLEQEKQQALTRAEAAEKRDLILQGQIQAKDEQISDLTSRIEDSNQRVSNAHKDTVSAKSNYDKVRADDPHFNASDDAGRVSELGSKLRELYPDSPR
jgi:chromosome segregation ATPase